MKEPEIIRELRQKKAELVASGHRPPFEVLISPAQEAEINEWLRRQTHQIPTGPCRAPGIRIHGMIVDAQ